MGSEAQGRIFNYPRFSVIVAFSQTIQRKRWEQMWIEPVLASSFTGPITSSLLPHGTLKENNKLCKPWHSQSHPTHLGMWDKCTFSFLRARGLPHLEYHGKAPSYPPTRWRHSRFCPPLSLLLRVIPYTSLPLVLLLQTNLFMVPKSLFRNDSSSQHSLLRAGQYWPCA